MKSEVFQLETVDLPPKKGWKKFDARMSREDRRAVAAVVRELAGELDPDLWLKLRREAQRFEECGTRVMLLRCLRDNFQFYRHETCKSRGCPECARGHAARIRKSLKHVLASCQPKRGWQFRMVTLTFQTDRFGDELPKKQHIARVYKESREFLNRFFGRYYYRQSRSGKWVENRKKWRGAGWVAVYEVGENNNNAHIHALTWGHTLKYEEMQSLSKTWLEITGDSNNVKMKVIDGTSKPLNYVTKYITKGIEFESYHWLASLMIMLKRVRRIRLGGIFYGRALRQKSERPQCPYCGERLCRDGFCDLGSVDGFCQELAPLRRLAEGEPGKLLQPPAWLVFKIVL